jgi:hypothetical protein
MNKLTISLGEVHISVHAEEREKVEELVDTDAVGNDGGPPPGTAHNPEGVEDSHVMDATVHAEEMEKVYLDVREMDDSRVSSDKSENEDSENSSVSSDTPDSEKRKMTRKRLRKLIRILLIQHRGHQ